VTQSFAHSSPLHNTAMNGQLHVPVASPLRKEPWHALNEKLGGPQRRCGLGPGLEPKAPGINYHYIAFFPDCLALEDGIYRLSQNVGE
jgi:hypothetical protein